MESIQSPYQHPADRHFAELSHKAQQQADARTLAERLAVPPPALQPVRQAYAAPADSIFYRQSHR